jgi:energy-coupling factor transport system ATP-binding protein
MRSKDNNMPVLLVSNLKFRYPEQNEPVLDNINLKLYPNELRVIVGPSGSGKSTILNTLCGFIPHSIDGELGGEIKIDGNDIKNKSIYEIAKDISLVQQDPEAQLCTSDVYHEVAFALENFMVPVREIRARVRNILNKLGILNIQHRKLHTLSGGEKQKVAIASMLVLKPKVLVFDEPTANLDPNSTRSFIQFLNYLKRETQVGIIIVDHNPSQYFSIADHILFLNHGKIEHIYRSHEFKEFNNQYYNKIFQVKSEKSTIQKVDYLAQHWNRLKVNTDNGKILKINNLNFKYNSQPALKNINLTIGRGEFIGLMGNNGSGKTTLIQNIMGLIGHNKGVIIYQFNGSKIYKKNTSELSENIGYVFQNPNHMIFGNTVWDEVMIGPKNFNKDLGISANKALNLLKLGGLTKYKKIHPMLLSHGEKRRLNLAAILSYDPELIILDEPFIGQDPENVFKIIQYLLQVVSIGKSVIMVTHRADIVNEFCNRLIFLKDGEIVLDGPVNEVFNRLSVLGEESYLPQTEKKFEEIKGCM